MRDNDKTKTDDELISKLKDPATFVQDFLKSLKPRTDAKTDAMPEKQLSERFLKVMRELTMIDRK